MTDASTTSVLMFILPRLTVVSTTFSLFIQEDKNMKHRALRLAAVSVAAVLTTFGVAVGNAVAKDKMVIAVPTFLTGGGAPAFGIPARNGTELIIQAINKGQVPAPYNTKGIAGAQVEAIIYDESGGGATQDANALPGQDAKMKP